MPALRLPSLKAIISREVRNLTSICAKSIKKQDINKPLAFLPWSAESCVRREIRETRICKDKIKPYSGQ